MLILILLAGTFSLMNLSAEIVDPDDRKELFRETPETKEMKSSVFWEKSGNEVIIGGSDISDDENKLYAPPPGKDTGNPQKIVPLGDTDMITFILLSIISVCCYLMHVFSRKRRI